MHLLATQLWLFYLGNVLGGNHNLHENPCKSWQKSRLNSPKNHTCRWYDDTQSCKISCPNSTSFVRYKNNKFLKNHICPNKSAFWLEICYFYISQTKSSLDKIFYKIVYHHTIYMCDFFGEFRRLFLPWFARVFTKFMVCTIYIPFKDIPNSAYAKWSSP